MSAAPPTRWWKRGRRWSPATRPTCPTGSPARSCTTPRLPGRSPGRPATPHHLGLLFLVTLDGRGPVRLEALLLKLEYCHTRLATGEDAAWMRRRFRAACAALDTTVEEEAGRLLINWR